MNKGGNDGLNGYDKVFIVIDELPDKMDVNVEGAAFDC